MFFGAVDEMWLDDNSIVERTPSRRVASCSVYEASVTDI